MTPDVLREVRRALGYLVLLALTCFAAYLSEGCGAPTWEKTRGAVQWSTGSGR